MLLDKLGIKDLFDQILVSSDYHLRKPDTKFYELLLSKLSMKSDEIVFTDDTSGNVDAAIKLGINAIHFQSAALLAEELKELGVKI